MVGVCGRNRATPAVSARNRFVSRSVSPGVEVELDQSIVDLIVLERQSDRTRSSELKPFLVQIACLSPSN